MKRALLAFAFLVNPAHAGEVTILKTPTCVAGAAVKVIEPEPDVIVINYFMAQAQRKIWLKNYYRSRPCASVGRVRSKVDGRCYKPSRLP